ncbi:ABC transporter permease [Mobilitalea sibirica]|uniref:ABC transporter permease n=1 Tax=Mobilitalea sibirica TaxID=1462919 RepID=A0A8J7L204_9FIRM|nr:ABC transporter permease [Mobilitalea sibirica]MBH1939698.1 ABC transporter permease [Mobilitalea sibirica]
MLNKLFKHEMKANARFLLPLYLILFVLSLINRVIIGLDIFDGALAIIPRFSIFAYIVSIIAVIVVTFIIMIMRFYKNLLSDEGYLMFTLTVESHQLIISKLLTAAIWIVSSVLAVFASLLLVFANPDSISEIWYQIRLGLTELDVIFKGRTTLLFIELAILAIFGLIHNILMIYLAIAIGHLFNGHKLLGSFVAYVGISMVMQTIISVLAAIVGSIFRESVTNVLSLPNFIFPIGIFTILILIVLYFFATNYIFRNKLNLE